MKLSEKFKNVFTYAAGVEDWCKSMYADASGYELEYTFCSDFAIADWTGGVDAVNETYDRVKESWLSDYKAFTEVIIALNLLAWANESLSRSGIDNRMDIMNNYSDLYYKAKDDFYKKYENNKEALSYMFLMTD